MLETDAQRAIFVDPKYGGTVVTLDNEFTFNAVIDDDFIESGEGVESSVPTATCRSIDLPSDVAQGNELIYYDINNAKKTYKIRGIEPDVSGMTRLILSEV